MVSFGVTLTMPNLRVLLPECLLLLLLLLFVITSMQGIYKYITEINNVSRAGWRTFFRVLSQKSINFAEIPSRGHGNFEE